MPPKKNKGRSRVFSYTKRDRFVIERAVDATGWAFTPSFGNTNDTIEADTSNSMGDVASLKMTKVNTTQVGTSFYKVLDEKIALADFVGGYVEFWAKADDMSVISQISVFFANIDDISNLGSSRTIQVRATGEVLDQDSGKFARYRLSLANALSSDVLAAGGVPLNDVKMILINFETNNIGDTPIVWMSEISVVSALPVSTDDYDEVLHKSVANSAIEDVYFEGNSVALSGIHVNNNEAAVSYLQIFELKASEVTLGTTEPLMVFPIASSDAEFISFPERVKFERCSFAVTTAKKGAAFPTAKADVTFIGRT